ncbi:MAG: hypothetical protein ACJARZ_001773 [Dokdonia sp.]|jgi:hypothetical protein
MDIQAPIIQCKAVVLKNKEPFRGNDYRLE